MFAHHYFHYMCQLTIFSKLTSSPWKVLQLSWRKVRSAEREREREWMHNKGNGYVMTCHHAITRSARRLFSGWAELKLDVHTQEKRKRENEKASEKEKWTVIMSWWVICQYPGQFWWKERERQVTWEERRMLETLHAVRMSVLNTDDWVKRERGRAATYRLIKVIICRRTVSHVCLSPAGQRQLTLCLHVSQVVNCADLLYGVSVDNWDQFDFKEVHRTMLFNTIL